MKYLEAAQKILAAQREPLHFGEIAKRALEQKLIQPQTANPSVSMASSLYADSQKEGSIFTREGNGRFGLAAWEPVGIEGQAQEINRGTRARLQERIARLSPERFEALIRELLIQMGFDESTVQMTPYRKDHGIDVTGTLEAAGLADVNTAVQVKHWQGNVGATTVTQLRGSLQVHQQGILITTSDFSKQARTEAVAPNKARIGLVNGEKLVDLLIKHRVGVVERHLTVTALDEEYWGGLAGEGAPEPGDFVAPSTEPPAGLPAEPEAHPRHPPGATPKEFVLFGERRSADSWRGVLVGSCEVLAQRSGDQFGPIATAVRGKSRQYVADSPEGMITPRPIPGTALWVEVNASAHQIESVIARLVAAFGGGPGDFEVIV
jgi:restriction system protein